MSETAKHPLRRKHRRGKRAGKRRPVAAAAPLIEAVRAASPDTIASLRSRLSQLHQRAV